MATEKKDQTIAETWFKDLQLKEKADLERRFTWLWPGWFWFWSWWRRARKFDPSRGLRTFLTLLIEEEKIFDFAP